MLVCVRMLVEGVSIKDSVHAEQHCHCACFCPRLCPHQAGLRGHEQPQLLVENPLCLNLHQYLASRLSKAALQCWNLLFLYLVTAVSKPRKHYGIVSYCDL